MNLTTADMTGFLVLSLSAGQSLSIGDTLLTVERVRNPYATFRIKTRLPIWYAGAIWSVPTDSQMASQDLFTLRLDRVLRIGSDIEIRPVRINGSVKVRLGIRAPKGIEIMRSEIDVRGPSPLLAALPAAKALIGGGK